MGYEEKLEKGREKALEASGGKHSKDMTTKEIISTVLKAYPTPNNETNAEMLERLNARRCGW